MFSLDLTPAAERALAIARGWSCYADGAGSAVGALCLQEVLLGLLAEPECRAATMLANRGIDTRTVRDRWPRLQEAHAAARSFSAPLEMALRAVQARLHEHPQPLVFGTEHLLLALVVADDEVARWLVERGFEADEIASEIDRLFGLVPGPLEYDFEEEATVRSKELPSLGAARKSDVPQSPNHEHLGLLRTLDAAANRAREGLRVVEDYVRFQLDDRHLTERLKSLRHRLAELLACIPADGLLAARETQADVGTQLATASEQSRPDIASLVAANFKRLEEALRSLEEHSKLLNSTLATGLEQLRYETYTLERAIGITRRSLERLKHARLYVLIDGQPDAGKFESLVVSLVEAGVHAIQLRDKRLPDRELLQRARLLRTALSGSLGKRPLFIMNDRPDLAVLAQADGVHVGQEELTVRDARAIVGPDLLVGVSTHSIEQARQAVLDGADYLGVGPVFPSGTKQFDQFPGLDFVRQAAAEIRLPAFAIGGINAGNLGQVLAAGLSRVAVSGAIASAADPAAAARELLDRMA
jgi:thiamine-phosphate pyrophosphorylase